MNIISNLFQCSFCSVISINIANIKKHLRKNHKNKLQEIPDLDLFNSYIVIAEGQNLEANRFYFQVESKNKNKKQDSTSRKSSLEEQEEQEDFFTTAKVLFLQDLEVKEEKLQKKLSKFQLNKEDNLTPFQIRTRYINFLNNRNLQDLVSLSNLSKKEEDISINILVLNLQEILYLSIERSFYLNKISLNLLNSFEKDRTKNTPFKPLLKIGTKQKYFNLFSSFIVFLFKSFLDNSYKTTKLYSLSKEAIALLLELKDLLDTESILLLEKELDPDSLVAKAKKSLDSKFTKLRLKRFLQDRIYRNKEEEDTEEEAEEEEEEDLVSNSSLESSSSSSTVSSLNTISSSNSLDSSDSNYNSLLILQEAKSIERSSSKVSVQIKNKLLALYLILCKEDTSIYSFSSSIHSFFACKSIKPNLSFKDSLVFSQYYSAFIYCSQLLVIEYSFQEAFKANNPLLLYSTIKDFMLAYFNNSTPSCLGEILNLRSYCFAINKTLSSLSNILISLDQKDTLIYNKITISIEDLKQLFQEVIVASNTLLQEKLLFNIDYTKELKEFTLEAFSKEEDISNTIPFKCFKDFHPDIKLYNNYLISKLFSIPSLRRKFFTLSNNKLVLNKRQVKLYLKDIKEFLKLCLLLIYFTSGLPLRGTELCTFQYLNSNKNKRELYLDKSCYLFILNILANKGCKDKEQGSNIRYLPYTVSKIFLAYIVLVVPLVKMFNLELNTSSSTSIISLSPYFFYSNFFILSSKDLSYKINSFSILILGKKLNIQIYRQIIVGVIQNFMLERVEESSLTLLDSEESLSSNTQSIISKQMNHSVNTEKLHYARPTFLLPNIKINIQLRYLQFCLRYFEFFDLLQPNLESNTLSNTLQAKDILEKNNKDSVINSIALRFSKSSIPSVASFSILSSASSRKHSRNISSISTFLQDSRIVKKVKLLDLQNISSTINTSSTLSNLLKEFLNNKNAVYKSIEQELLVKSILLKVPYILAILATNQGKSLSYLLTSSLITSKITIVIIPLLGLKQDILRRAKEFGIPCSIFEDSKEFLNLTLISIETIRNSNFIFKVKELINNQKT